MTPMREKKTIWGELKLIQMWFYKNRSQAFGIQ